MKTSNLVPLHVVATKTVNFKRYPSFSCYYLYSNFIILIIIITIIILIDYIILLPLPALNVEYFGIEYYC